MGAPSGLRFICSYFTVFSAYTPQKHECFCYRDFKILVFYSVSYIPRLQNPRILRCFLHTEASKPSYFTVFPTWYASKTRVFLLPRLQNPRILRCFLHGMPQKHECFCPEATKSSYFTCFLHGIPQKHDCFSLQI